MATNYWQPWTWLLVFVVSMLCLSTLSFATTYYVGGQFGWKNYDTFTNQVPNYTSWASAQTIFPGDLLVFQYSPNFHNVFQFVDKASYDICDFGSALQLDSGESGIFTWQPIKPGIYYFGCSKIVEGFGTHCTGGQKVTLTIWPSASNISKPPASLPSIGFTSNRHL